MLTMGLMTLLSIFLGYLLLARDKQGKQNVFFDLDTTMTMRGFWCLIVVLVHIPEAHQNPIQDLLGSFAYIGVTFFFMTSSFGLMLSLKKDPVATVQGFWRRRLSKLLLPMLVVNVMTVAAEAVMGQSSIWQLIHITGFVRQLLLFYLAFWLVFSLPNPRLGQAQREKILCIAVVIISLVIYFANGFGVLGWPTESFGFLYGIMLAKYKDQFANKLSIMWLKKCAIFCLAAFVLGITYLKFKSIVFVGDYLTKILLGMAILGFMLCVNTRYSIGNPAGRFLGNISYEIYLVHDLVFRCLDYARPNLNSGVFISVSIVITILLSVVVHRIGKNKIYRKK